MAALRVEATNIGSLQPYTNFNRRFGAMLEQVEAAPQTVVVILEGAVLRVLGWHVFPMLPLAVTMRSLVYLKLGLVCDSLHKLLLLW